tara:strand:+ start:364 stop:984 length:621 start_codon:yes stop_codon:yes gene_type:complete
MANKKESTFEVLNKINVNDHTEEKNGLTYLSWAYAWGEVKAHYPDSEYKVYENGDGLNYHHDGKTAWVKTGVVISGKEHIEYLPVLDYRNKSIPLERLDSFAVNSAIQRSITKAIARHGLGLYIYQGEKEPENERAETLREKLPELKPGKWELVIGDTRYKGEVVEEKGKLLFLYKGKKKEIKYSPNQVWIAIKENKKDKKTKTKG